MANNATTHSCLLITLLRQSNNRHALIGLKILIGVDIVPTLFTIAANGILLLTLIRTKSLQTPANALLGALCFSDLLVGVVSQSIFLHVAVKVHSLKELDSRLRIAFLLSNIIFNGMSFIMVLYITLDRYIAICHPFLYKQSFTCKRYIILVALTWVYKVIPPFLGTTFYLVYYAVITTASFVIIFICYKKIYAAIRKQEQAVIRLGKIGDEEKDILHRNRQERSKAYTILILLVVFTVTYVPTLAVSLTAFLEHRNANICKMSPDMFVVFMGAIFFLNLSSVINPLVYCIRLKPIKVAASSLVFSTNIRVAAT